MVIIGGFIKLFFMCCKCGTKSYTYSCWKEKRMSEFDAIRPYHDDEVVPVLNRLVNDIEFLDAIVRLKVPSSLRFLNSILRPFVRWKLTKEVETITSITDFQVKIDPYLTHVIDSTTTETSVSGLDKLDPTKSYLFISNHRDIAMDPAVVNLMLYRKKFNTLRIAIGDNLLTKPFSSDLMRLNKCFLVKRSLTAPREKFKAAKLLSKYIRHSVLNDKENVWIAQREGRAKDGLDKTNAAIISMLALSKAKTDDLSDYIRESHIVPVSISYEYDPCGEDKARELYKTSTEGSYIKDEHEDVKSIAKGITGFKGRVHLSFGDVLDKPFASIDEVAEEIENKIIENYCLQITNCFAYEMLEGKSPDVVFGPQRTPYTEQRWAQERERFEKHIATVQEEYRSTLLKAYANPVKAKLALVC